MIRWLASLSVVILAASSPQLLVTSYVPKFIAFYNDAVHKNLDEAGRWALWRQEYGIAAVPPTAEGQALARQQLDAAWPHYASLVPSLGADERSAESTARVLLPDIAALLTDDPERITVRLVLIVGQFDGNSFAYRDPNSGTGTAFISVEIPDLRLAEAHEMAHAVHFEVANVKKGYVAPLGETVWLEGIAMRSTQRLVQGFPEEKYVGATSAWLATCRQQRVPILRGILDNVAAESQAVTSKFTYGAGSTGLGREAYCAGWLLVGYLLDHGRTLKSLAAIQEPDMVPFVRQTLSSMLAVAPS